MAITIGLTTLRKMLKIIVTGPESTGKTTLCEYLSKHYKTSLIQEYAREYIENLNKEYKKEDLLIIAKKQYSLEKIEKKILICDTDLITIKIWSEYKYGCCDKLILELIKLQRNENRLYLLCKDDIPWKYDNQRENPYNRGLIFNIYKKELTNLGHKYIIIKGKKRKETAISSINNLISPN